MKGIVHLGDGRVDVTTELEVREPGPRELVVRVVNAGLCHSDVSVIDGTIPYPAPCALGHEGAGIVEEVGREVTSVRPGDRVILSTMVNCGRCPACASGFPSRCPRSIGVMDQVFSLHGEPVYNFAATSCFSELTVVHEIQAVPLPEGVPMSSACLIGCGVMTGVGAVLNRADVSAGQAAAVFGVGGVGLNALQALRLIGASPIIAIDANPDKAPIAEQFGATHFVASSPDLSVPDAIRDLVARGRGAFSGGGVDWAFECSGVPAVLRQALESLDWGGTAVAVGVPPWTAELDAPIMPLIYIDRGLIGCRAGTPQPHRDFAKIAHLYLDGKLLLDELVSGVFPHAEFLDVVEQLEQGRLARAVLSL